MSACKLIFMDTKTYPAIIVLVEEAHKLASSQLHFILKSRLEVKLHTVDSGVGGTSSGGDGGRASGSVRLVTGAGRVGAERGSRGRSRDGRQGCRRCGQGQVQCLGTVLAGRRLASQTSSGDSSSTNCRSTCSNSGTVGSGVGRDITHGSARSRLADVGKRLLVEAHGADGLLGDGTVDSLGLGTKGVRGVRALVRCRSVPGALARVAKTQSSSSRSQVGVHVDGRSPSRSSAGALVEVQVGQELGNGAKTDARSAGVLATSGSGGGSKSMALLILIGQTLLLHLLLATVKEEEDEQKDDENTG